MPLFDVTLSTLGRALDVRLTRQTVLAANLANANTPGFTPREVDFDAAMADAARALLSPDAQPAPAVASASPDRFVVDDPGASPGLDGNAVDVDRTSAAIAENAIQYGAAARAAAKKLAILRYVASDGAA